MLRKIEPQEDTPVTIGQGSKAYVGEGGGVIYLSEEDARRFLALNEGPTTNGQPDPLEGFRS